MSERTGGCLCGQVRFRLTAEPLASRICWCRDCQHIAGNGTVNAIFPASAIEITGGTSAFVSTAESGNQVTRRFCPQCGCHLFADSSGRPGFSVVRVGTLDDPSSIKPSVNMWSASAPSWACLDASIQAVERQPVPPQPAKPAS
ncbi:MAG: GFA family protein [Paucibacter sp.]|nr:GFA family protein [Roseateles sp.]